MRDRKLSFILGPRRETLNPSVYRRVAIMKSVFFVFGLCGLFALTACNIKDPNEANKDLQKKIDADIKINEETLADVKKSISAGGVPGQIQLSGVVVQANSQIDPRITVVMKAGLSKDGTSPEYKDRTQPILKAKTKSAHLERLEKDKNHISIGCEKKALHELAEQRSLLVQDLPAPLNDGVMLIAAKTIVLCGKLDPLKFRHLSFIADEMILDHFEYTHQGTTGYLQILANKLVLQGSNQVATKGSEWMAKGLPFAPSIELSVIKAISSTSDGHLVVMSMGSDFKE